MGDDETSLEGGILTGMFNNFFVRDVDGSIRSIRLDVRQSHEGRPVDLVIGDVWDVRVYHEGWSVDFIVCRQNIVRV